MIRLNRKNVLYEIFYGPAWQLPVKATCILIMAQCSPWFNILLLLKKMKERNWM